MPKTWPRLAQQTLTLLDEGTPEAPSISDMFGEVVQGMASLSRIDTCQNRPDRTGRDHRRPAERLALELRTYLEGIEFNPRRLEQVEERLDLIHKLQRKYGGSIEAVLAFAEKARQELDTIAHATERIAELEAAGTAGAEACWPEKGQALSQTAQRGRAQSLETGVERELNDLSMSGARFAVDFQLQPDPLVSAGKR